MLRSSKNNSKQSKTSLSHHSKLAKSLIPNHNHKRTQRNKSHNVISSRKITTGVQRRPTVMKKSTKLISQQFHTRAKKSTKSTSPQQFHTHVSAPSQLLSTQQHNNIIRSTSNLTTINSGMMMNSQNNKFIHTAIINNEPIFSPKKLKSKKPTQISHNSFTTSTQSESSQLQHSDPLITSLFTTLNNGLEPMLATNPGMTITVDKDVFELDLGQENGVYHFERDPNENFLISKTHTHAIAPIVYMTSPITGNIHRYYYDNKRLHNWISIDDEHYLVELMTRELLKKCYGYPMF